MAEPIGIASGILALVVAAYKTSVTLTECIQSFRDQPKKVRELRDQVGGIQSTLQTINRQAASTGADGGRLEPLRAPLLSCERICLELFELLKKCTPNSKDGRRSIRDWLRLEHNEKRFDELKERLEVFKSTLTVTMQTVTLSDSAKTHEAITKLVQDVEDIQNDIKDQLQDIQRAVRDSSTADAEALEEHRKLLQACLETLNKEADKTKKGSKVRIERNEADTGAVQANAGDISSLPANLGELNIIANKASTGAAQANGMFTSETIQAFLSNARPDLVLALEALRNMPSGTQRENLDPLINNLSSSARKPRAGTVNQTHQSTSGLLLEEGCSDPMASFSRIQDVGDEATASMEFAHHDSGRRANPRGAGH